MKNNLKNLCNEYDRIMKKVQQEMVKILEELEEPEELVNECAELDEALVDIKFMIEDLQKDVSER